MSKKGDKGLHNKTEDRCQWIAAIPESLLTSGTPDSLAFCKLRHPRTDHGAFFMLAENNTKLLEVVRFNEDYRSWFIGQTVQADGSLYMTTPCDPVYLILPYLIKASQSGKFMQLDVILEDEQYGEVHRLCTCQGVQHLHQVADVKGHDDLKVYRYSEEKTLSWLKSKVQKLATTLENKRIQTGTMGSHDVSFVQSTKSTSTNKDDYMRYAHGMISEYLSPSLSVKLKDHMGIKDIIVHEKPEIKEPTAKKRKSDITPTEDYSQRNGADQNDNKKASKVTSAQKKLDKVDKSGMKSISSFFSPKPAKAKK